MWMKVLPAIMAGGMLIGAAHADEKNPSRRAITKAVQKYLQEQGDLCVGKFTWPRDVTADDRQQGSNDALQLPVLERLGLVESVEIPAVASVNRAAAAIGLQPGAPVSPQLAPAAPARRYSLTDKGRQFYLRRKMTSLGSHDEAADHDGDFCVAHLSLDKVVKWTPPEGPEGHVQTLVAYTYRIKPADWTADPEVRQVFPRVDMIIHSAGTLQLNESFRLLDGNWIPVLPGQ